MAATTVDLTGSNVVIRLGAPVTAAVPVQGIPVQVPAVAVEEETGMEGAVEESDRHPVILSVASPADSLMGAVESAKVPRMAMGSAAIKKSTARRSSPVLIAARSVMGLLAISQAAAGASVGAR